MCYALSGKAFHSLKGFFCLNKEVMVMDSDPLPGKYNIYLNSSLKMKNHNHHIDVDGGGSC